MRPTTPLEKVLSTDAIHEFEQRTGKSYRENNDAENMAMLAFHMRHNDAKCDLLKQAGDTTFSMSGDEYAANIEAFGFREVYSEPFTAEHCGRVNHDVLKVYWHDDGLLLYFDTYCGNRNSGKLWYNWRPLPYIDCQAKWQCTSSGGYEKIDGELIWAGYHDCREAIRTNINRLREWGEFLVPWRKQPFALWVRHYGETGGSLESHDDKSRERIDKLPKDIQEAILHI